MTSFYRRFVWPTILFVWLRLRIRYNQMTRSSKIAQAFAVLGILVMASSMIGVWAAGVLIGVFVPTQLGLENYFLIWDALLLVALVSWVIHVLNEAQRGDPISLDRILHLPVSPGQAFVVNYLSSLGSTVFLMSTGGFLGLVIGSVFSVGPRAILFLFPMFAFLFAMTAITYWLQGWIADLMSNPRRRQTIIVMIPLTIVATIQLPIQLMNWSARSSFPRESRARSTTEVTNSSPDVVAEKTSPDGQPESRESENNEPMPKTDVADVSIVQADTVTANGGDAVAAEAIAAVDGIGTSEMLATGSPEDEAPNTESSIESNGSNASNATKLSRAQRRAQQREAALSRWKSIASIANLAFPPLWSAGAIEALNAESGWSLTPIFLTLVMVLVGVQALRQSHRATLRYWRGEQSHKRQTKSGAIKSEKESVQTKGESRLCEKQIPFTSEETSAVATMTWATMKRAPEIKMFMLMPMIAPLILIFVLRGRMLPTNDLLKSLIIGGFSVFFLLVSSGVAGNMFGYDRSGFRVFVLAGMDRTKILLGRNLAYIPILCSLCLLSFLGFAILYGVSFRAIITMVWVTFTMLPPYLLLMNAMSILTPFPLSSGSIQPKHFDFRTVVINVLLSMILPCIWMVSLIPIGVQYLLTTFAPSIAWFPFELILAMAMCAGSIGVYKLILPWQGQLLAKREKEILRIVTSKVE